MHPINFGLNNYFKAAICLILASNTPPPPPHAAPATPHPPPPSRHGVGWVGYLRQGLSKLLP